MRGIFGLIGLVAALAVVGVLISRQMTAVRSPVPVLQAPAAGASAAAPSARRPVTEQVQQQMDSLMQAPRPMPDAEK